MRRISALFVALSFGVIGAAAAASSPRTTQLAASEWLNNKQITTLFSGGLSFSLEFYSKRRGTFFELDFTYKDDGTWEAMHPKGKLAWGDWRIEGRKLCRDMTGYSDDWNGLKKPSVCAGIKLKDAKLYYGKNGNRMNLEDFTDLARIPGAFTLPQTAAAEPRRNADRLAREKRELEEQRLDLERER